MKRLFLLLLSLLAASGQIYVKNFAACNGAVEHAALVAAFAAATNEPLIFQPNKTCVFDPTQLRIDISGKTIIAEGATLKNGYYAVTGGSSTNWTGGTLLQDGTTDNFNSPKILATGGTGLRFTGLTCTNATSYACFQLSGANNVWIDKPDIFQAGLNSITITQGKHIHITNGRMKGTPGGSDDGIAIVDGGGDVQDVVIANMTGEDIYDILKIVNVTNTVRDVSVTGCTGTNVVAPLYIQTSGAVATNNISLSGCNFFDTTGSMAENLVRYAISGGATVRNVKVNNVTFRGRTYPVNNSIAQITNTGATIDGLEVTGLRWDDIYNGAANGGSAPGYPANMGFVYSASGAAAASNIKLDSWFINGTATYAIRVTSPITNFSVWNMYGKNLYKTNPTGTLVSVTAGSIDEFHNTWIR